MSTRGGLPQYGAAETYAFDSAELAPDLDATGARRVNDHDAFWVHIYRSTNGSATRFEKWVDKGSGRIHWRTRSPDGSISIFGERGGSRLCDPDDNRHVYQWLCERQYDRDGNAIHYEYVREDDRGVDVTASYERHRLARGAQRYLQRILYGNSAPTGPDAPVAVDWRFSVVFDHGEREPGALGLETSRPWPVRADPFSTFRPGFEVRTYRLCRQILMFHHFPDEIGEPATLVGVLRLEHDERAAGSMLTRVRYTGLRRDASRVTEAELPAIAFGYTEARLGSSFEPVPVETERNVPGGLGSLTHRLVDLLGEGLPGILTETRDAWYFKPNLGGGRFAAQRIIPDRPASSRELVLADFDGDGNVELVVLEGAGAGYYAFDRDRNRWHSYRTFPTVPQISGASALQLLDLSGSGRADLVSVSPERIVCWRSKGRDGFEPPIETTMPRSNGVSRSPTLGPAPELDYFFADMTGDGLLDQVRIQNGRVEYWPQIGHGVFGPGIVMDGSPTFEHHGEVDPRRLRLVDLDGSGTADLLYIGRGEIRCWINASGNRFLEGGVIRGLPFIDNLDSVTVNDFLGNGTLCLVWSTQLQGNGSMRYLPLTGETRARLLTSVDDGVGREYRVDYGHSSRHYLRDLETERPWTTRLPGHRVVVDRLEVHDRIGGSRAVTRYEYRDGFYDGAEQAFRGFGLVDRFDREFSDRGDPADESDPVCVRTWFHPGAPGWEARRARDYYAEDAHAASVGPTVFDGVLTSDDFAAAHRALAGQLIRTEIYRVDPSGRRAHHPYQVIEAGFRVRLVQAGDDGIAPCFAVSPRESLRYTYEQDPMDPRVDHAFTVAIDRYGQMTRRATVAYPRRASVPTDIPAQRELRCELIDNRVAHVDEPDRLLLGTPLEVRRFEVRGLVPSADAGRDAVLRITDFESAASILDDPSAATRVLRFDQAFTGGVELRVVQWERMHYWNDARTDVLPWSSVGRDVLAHHKESACLTDAFVADVLRDRVDAAALAEAGYRFHDGHWWHDTARVHYLPASGFNLVEREVRAVREGGAVVDASTRYGYDRHLLIQTTVADAVGNQIRADHVDYCWLAPDRIIDANENVSEVHYDALGVVTVSSEHGAILGPTDETVPYGNDPLETYVPQLAPSLEEMLHEPARFLQGATTYVWYELDAGTPEAPRPVRSVSLVRESFVHPYSSAGASSEIRVRIVYLDGFGRTIQTRERVGAGPVDYVRDEAGQLIRPTPLPEVSERWWVSGFTTYNQKQLVVRAYEPSFSTTFEFEADTALRSFGTTTVTRYDALGRVSEIRLPNGTRSRSEYAAWERRSYDQNDTVIGSDYEAARAALGADDPERIALEGARRHANTFTRFAVDPAGRDVAKLDDDGDLGVRRVDTRLDFDGNVVAVVDPRLIEVATFRRDMVGRVVHRSSVDAGKTWALFDAWGRTSASWDERGNHRVVEYDRLGRPIAVTISDGTRARVSERFGYGDRIADTTARNARGRLVERFDGAGVTRVQVFDPTGTPLRHELQLAVEYRAPIDWSHPDTVPLEPERHATRAEVDNLGRLTTEVTADGLLRRYVYQRGGGLARILASTPDGSWTDRVVLDRADYNARGQRTSAVLGDAARDTPLVLENEFDPDTFRVHTIRVRSSSRTYQELAYTYDPVGNVVYTRDRAQEAAVGDFYRGLPVLLGSGSAFTYDALYRLTSATGRVHRALEQTDDLRDGPDLLRGARRADLEDLGQIRRYLRTYQYDLAGNLRSMVHTTFGIGTEGDRGWTDMFAVSETSNRAVRTDLAGPGDAFDACGNCTQVPHLSRIEWNDRNQLARAVIILRSEPDTSGARQPDDAEYYVYAADGGRVRRVTERLQHGRLVIEEKIYIGSCELKRIRSNGSPLLERWTSHVTHEGRLFARVHRWTHDIRALEVDDVGPPRLHFTFGNHLGSTTLEINERGEVITYEEYFPYGGTAFVASRDGRDVAIKDYRYSGKERDDATGFYYYGYRYYASWLARWLSPDPSGLADGPNLYLFVHANPTTFRDPDGRLTEVLIPSSQLATSVPADVHWEWLVRRGAAPDDNAPSPFFTLAQEGQFEEWLRRETEANPKAEFVLFVYDPIESRALQDRLDQLAGLPTPRQPGSPTDIVPVDLGAHTGPDPALDRDQLDAALDELAALDGDDPIGGLDAGGGLEHCGGGEQGGGHEQHGGSEQRGGTEAGRGTAGHGGGDDDGVGGGAPQSGDGDGNRGRGRSLGGTGTGRGVRGSGRGGGGENDNVGVGSAVQEQGHGVGVSGAGTGGIGGGGRGRGAHGAADAHGTHAGAKGLQAGGGENGAASGGGTAGVGGVEGGDASASPTVPPEGTTPATRSGGTPDGLEGSSGHGGLVPGSNGTGSRLGVEGGDDARGSLLSGDESGTQAADLGDRIVSAVGIANMDFIGYDPRNSRARDSGIPGGVLGVWDFGETANQTIYVVGSIAMMILGGIGEGAERPRPRAASSFLTRAGEFVERYLPHLRPVLERFEGAARWGARMLESPATRRLRDADRVTVDMGRFRFSQFVPWHREWDTQAPAQQDLIPGFSGIYSDEGSGHIVIRPSVADMPGTTRLPLPSDWVAQRGGHDQVLSLAVASGQAAFERPMAFTLMMRSETEFGVMFRSQSVNERYWRSIALPEAQQEAVMQALGRAFPDLSFFRLNPYAETARFRVSGASVFVWGWQS